MRNLALIALALVVAAGAAGMAFAGHRSISIGKKQELTNERVASITFSVSCENEAGYTSAFVSVTQRDADPTNDAFGSGTQGVTCDGEMHQVTVAALAEPGVSGNYRVGRADVSVSVAADANTYLSAAADVRLR